MNVILESVLEIFENNFQVYFVIVEGYMCKKYNKQYFVIKQMPSNLLLRMSKF